jgi:hypothetical protein
LFSHLRLGLPSSLLLSGFPTKTLYAPLLSSTRATCFPYLSISTASANNNSNTILCKAVFVTGDIRNDFSPNRFALPAFDMRCLQLNEVQWLPKGLTFTNCTFCPHSVFVYFVWIWEQTAIISLYSINWLVFITETDCVYCAVRSAHTVHLCVLCGSENKQRLFHCTALIGWFL